MNSGPGDSGSYNAMEKIAVLVPTQLSFPLHCN